MRNFDALIDDFHKQFPTLKEAETGPTLSGMVKGAVGAVTGGRARIQVDYKPENVYYLQGGYKNLPELRKRLAPLLKEAANPLSAPSPASTGTNPPSAPSPASTGTPTTGAQQPKAISAQGIIADKNMFATLLYNAFDTASERQQNYISLNELLSGHLRPRKDTGIVNQKQEEIGETTNAPKPVVHGEIMKFLNEYKLSDLVLYVSPQQATELDKGSVGKRVLGAVDRFAGQAIKDLGTLQGKVNYL